MIDFHEVVDDEFTIGDDVQVMLASDPARRQHRRLPVDVERAVGRLHERPPDAGRRVVRGHAGCARTVRRRRPADPRRAVHAGGVREKTHVGSLHRRVRGVAGRRVRREAAGAVPPRSRPPRRPDRRCSARRPPTADVKMGVEVFAAREGLSSNSEPRHWSVEPCGGTSRRGRRSASVLLGVAFVVAGAIEDRRRESRGRRRHGRSGAPSGSSRSCRGSRSWSARALIAQFAKPMAGASSRW